MTLQTSAANAGHPLTQDKRGQVPTGDAGVMKENITVTTKEVEASLL
jgi:hypothetical protein